MQDLGGDHDLGNKSATKVFLGSELFAAIARCAARESSQMIQSRIRDRIGVKEFKLEQLPENRCAVQVVLEWPEGDGFAGTAWGEDSEMGRLRCAADAAARAVALSVNHEIALKPAEVRTIQESNVGIVLILLSGQVLGETQRLVGSCIIGEEPARSAALSVLKATNRLMGGVIFSFSG